MDWLKDWLGGPMSRDTIWIGWTSTWAGASVYGGKSTIFSVVESTTPLSWIPTRLALARYQICCRALEIPGVCDPQTAPRSDARSASWIFHGTHRGFCG